MKRRRRSTMPTRMSTGMGGTMVTFFLSLYWMHRRVVHFSLGWKKLARVRPST